MSTSASAPKRAAKPETKNDEMTLKIIYFSKSNNACIYTNDRNGPELVTSGVPRSMISLVSRMMIFIGGREVKPNQGISFHGLCAATKKCPAASLVKIHAQMPDGSSCKHKDIILVHQMTPTQVGCKTWSRSHMQMHGMYPLSK